MRLNGAKILGLTAFALGVSLGRRTSGKTKDIYDNPLNMVERAAAAVDEVTEVKLAAADQAESQAQAQAAQAAAKEARAAADRQKLEEAVNRLAQVSEATQQNAALDPDGDRLAAAQRAAALAELDAAKAAEARARAEADAAARAQAEAARQREQARQAALAAEAARQREASKRAQQQAAPPAPAPAPSPAYETQIHASAPAPAPSPQPSPSTVPPGYDPTGARKMAPSLARHLKRAGRANYDRRLVQDFQRKAGLAADKIYGGATAGALLYYGGSEAPGPFFPPLDVIPYTPPA